ncbi:MAG: histidine kinase [Calditrichae bacterium]|nr:histidine kinase [Calditrichota bacterium]MCB9058938.1 histidine kinase [Calditrichia bacterium]
MSEKIKNASVVLLIWTAVGFLYSLQSYYYRIQVNQQADWLKILMVDTPYFVFWSFFTPIPLYFSRRFPFVKKNWLSLLVIHFMLAMVIAFIHSLIYMTFRMYITIGSFQDIEIASIYINAVANFDYGILVYFVILLVLNVLEYYKRFQQEKTQNAELQSALITAQLDALKMKLQPHFLFNTLNSISVLIKDNPQKAGETVNRLSDLLRHVLNNVDDQFTELENEISFIRQYLAIEKVRFGERLTVTIELDDGLKKVPVPSLLLQPIVENAIRHGIARRRGKGVIDIKVFKNNHFLTIDVSDNGIGYNPQKGELEKGLGLKITTDRLKSLFGDEYKLNIVAVKSGGTKVSLQIPVPGESK